MNKVYLVVTEQGSYDDYWWNIYCICSNAHKAEEEKQKLKKKIESVKAEYEKEFGRDYDYDKENMLELEREERWDQVYAYDDKHKELKYHTIRIEEREVL